MRRSGMRPADTVLVSFVGALPEYDAMKLFPQPGVRYDWGFMRGLHAAVIVEPGIDAEESIKALARVCEPYVAVVDVQKKRVAFALDDTCRLWHAAHGSPSWQDWFSEVMA